MVAVNGKTIFFVNCFRYLGGLIKPQAVIFYPNCLYFHFTSWRRHEDISCITANEKFAMVCLNRAVLGTAIEASTIPLSCLRTHHFVSVTDFVTIPCEVFITNVDILKCFVITFCHTLFVSKRQIMNI